MRLGRDKSCYERHADAVVPMLIFKDPEELADLVKKPYGGIPTGWLS